MRAFYHLPPSPSPINIPLQNKSKVGEVESGGGAGGRAIRWIGTHTPQRSSSTPYRAAPPLMNVVRAYIGALGILGFSTVVTVSCLADRQPVSPNFYSCTRLRTRARSYKYIPGVPPFSFPLSRPGGHP